MQTVGRLQRDINSAGGKGTVSLIYLYADENISSLAIGSYLIVCELLKPMAGS